ncbi:hypothetical protein V202x_53220 [Gimesia aquarii]|uniref:Uncharacterized protein n=1 Tax=Gimesia aquarii TaxID=2527964 RepID=A0A517X315_9PLAN|nr:hypothetical protein V202x_53220 [Gimesia aquarii]
MGPDVEIPKRGFVFEEVHTKTSWNRSCNILMNQSVCFYSPPEKKRTLQDSALFGNQFGVSRSQFQTLSLRLRTVDTMLQNEHGNKFFALNMRGLA